MGIACAIVAADTQAAGTVYDLSMLSSYDSNANRAPTARDRDEDLFATAAAAVRHQRVLAPSVGLQLGAHGHLTARRRNTDLNHAGVGADAWLHFKPQPGASAPWYVLGAAVGARGYADSAQRDGVHGKLGARVGVRPVRDWVVQAGYEFDWREATGAEVFDLHGHGLFASVDHRLTPALTLYGRYELRDGDMVVTALPSPRLAARASAIELDDGGQSPFAGGPLQPGRLSVYRIDAVTHTARAGFNYGFSQELSLDVSARWLNANLRGGAGVQSWEVAGGLLFLFR